MHSHSSSFSWKKLLRARKSPPTERASQIRARDLQFYYSSAGMELQICKADAAFFIERERAEQLLRRIQIQLWELAFSAVSSPQHFCSPTVEYTFNLHSLETLWKETLSVNMNSRDTNALRITQSKLLTTRVLFSSLEITFIILNGFA